MHRRQSPYALSGFIYAAALGISGLFSSHAIAQQPAASSPVSLSGDPTDPYESTNRAIFGFNEDVDRAVLVPVANAYRAVLPGPIRDSIHDFLQNLNAPIIFANDVLQGQANLAGETLGRFIVNTTLGVGGIVDVATKAGIPYHTNDLGITFATWGIDSGPYMMLPVLGPSNPRDLIGDIGDSFGDPGNIVASNHNKLWTTFARAATSGIDERSRNIESLAEIERTSLDYYATIRSLARQRRAAQIRHQKEDVPNATPLQGTNTLQPPAAPKTVAELTTPAMSYQMVSPQSPPNSIADLQKSSMTPSTAHGR
jgi:phospholipid-binding lipoprotein MlaA